MEHGELLSMIRPLVLVVSGTGRITRAAGGYGGFLGLDIEGLEGTSVFNFVEEHQHDELASYFLDSVGEALQIVSLPVSFRMDVRSTDGHTYQTDVIASGRAADDGTWEWVVVMVPLELQSAPVRSLDAEMSGAARSRVKELLAGESNVENRFWSTRGFLLDFSEATGVACTPSREEDLDVAEMLVQAAVIDTWAPWDGLGSGDTLALGHEIPERLAPRLQELGWRRLSVTAVRSDHELLAVIVVLGRVPSDHHVDTVMANVRTRLRRLADTTLLIMDRWRERERLMAAATRDAVTGLANREGFLESIGRARAVGFSLLYLDLDDFKSVNDEFGHQTGDAVLAEVGRRIEAACRPEDLVARFGGDEFVVLLPGAGVDDASIIGERIMAGVGQPLQMVDGPIQVTISVGLAPAPADPQALIDPDDLLDRADRAMLGAKRQGRARLVTSSIPS